jgi:DNA-binding MarR family transcriptional regulator
MARESAHSASAALRVASSKSGAGQATTKGRRQVLKNNGSDPTGAEDFKLRSGVPVRSPEGEVVRYRIEEQIGYLLRRAHQRATAVFQSRIGDEDITPTQYTSLVKLLEHEELSQNRLGRLVAMDKATTQGVVRRLKSRELVASRPDPGDARRTLLRLTGQGRRLVEQLAANGPDVSREILRPLPAGDQRMLLDLLRRLV